jgi:ribosomal protein L23
MTIIINKKLSKKELKLAIEKLFEKRKHKGLQKHFGISKEIIDALAYQKEARNEWN